MNGGERMSNLMVVKDYSPAVLLPYLGSKKVFKFYRPGCQTLAPWEAVREKQFSQAGVDDPSRPWLVLNYPEALQSAFGLLPGFISDKIHIKLWSIVLQNRVDEDRQEMDALKKRDLSAADQTMLLEDLGAVSEVILQLHYSTVLRLPT